MNLKKLHIAFCSLSRKAILISHMRTHNEECNFLTINLIINVEAERQEQINKATGEAAAVVAVAEARAKGLQVVANALGVADAKNAAALSVAEQYVNAFNKLAKVNNTLILPSNVGDVSTFVAQVCQPLFVLLLIKILIVLSKCFVAFYRRWQFINK